MSAVSSPEFQPLLRCPDAVQVPIEGISVSMDIRLGDSFSNLDVNSWLSEFVLDTFAGDDAGPQPTRLELTADAPRDPKKKGSITYGDYEDGVVRVHMGSVVGSIQKDRKEREDAGNPMPDHEANIRLSFRASETAAHELAHRADDTVIGVEALKKERRRYELPRILPRLLPQAVLMLGGMGLSGSVAYVAEAAGYSPIAPWTIGTLGVLSTIGLTVEGMRSRYKTIANTYNMYKDRPSEKRAVAHEDAYYELLEKGSYYLITGELRTPQPVLRP